MGIHAVYQSLCSEYSIGRFYGQWVLKASTVSTILIYILTLRIIATDRIEATITIQPILLMLMDGLQVRMAVYVLLFCTVTHDKPGPTSILTFFTLGLSITSPRGHTWSVAPHVLGGINDVQGGFETSLGSFGVNWTLSASGVFELGIQTPEDSSGIVKLPRSLLNNNETGVIVELDGEETQYSLTGGLEVSGGHHELVVRNSTSTA